MQIRLLGAHQGESRDTRFLSILVDEVLAVDAGSLASALTFAEQQRLRAILVTHYHYDHIKDIPSIGFNNPGSTPMSIYALATTRQALQTHLMNDSVWPRLDALPDGAPRVRYVDVTPGVAVELDGYRVLPLSMSHTVPTVGFLMARDGKSFFYTSDTRGGAHEVWAAIAPDLIISEATLPDEQEAEAERFGHMTPRMLARELAEFRSIHGYIPRTVAVHINARFEDRVRADLERAALALGSPIEIGYAGMTVSL